jgi:hypothetical protein
MPGWSLRKGVNAAVEIAYQTIAIQQFNDQAGEGTSAHVTVIQARRKDQYHSRYGPCGGGCPCGRKKRQVVNCRIIFSIPAGSYPYRRSQAFGQRRGRPAAHGSPMISTMQLWALIEDKAAGERD